MTQNALLKISAANQNAAAADRYLYVVQIDQAYGIKLILPRNRGVDEKVTTGRPQGLELKLAVP